MKTSKCNKGCGVELYFSDTILSQNGKKIPLEVEYAPDDVKKEHPQFNGKHHNCPNSDYAKKDRSETKQIFNTGTTKVNIKPLELKPEDQTLIDQENRYYYVAFLIAKERYPDVDQNSDKFGQITNAICNRVVKLKSDMFK